MSIDPETFRRRPWLALLLIAALAGDYLLFRSGEALFVDCFPLAAFVVVASLTVSYDAKHPRTLQLTCNRHPEPKPKNGTI